MRKKNSEKEVYKNTKYDLSIVHHSNIVRYLKLRANDKISSIDIDVTLQTGESFPIRIVADKKFDAKYEKIIHIGNPHNSKRVLNDMVLYFANNEYLNFSIYSQLNSQCQYFLIISIFDEIDTLLNTINSASNLIITVHYDNPEEERIERNKLKGEVAEKKIYKLFGDDSEKYNINYITLESNYRNMPFNMLVNEGSMKYTKCISPFLTNIYHDEYPETIVEKCYEIYSDKKDDKKKVNIDDMLDLLTDYFKYSDNTIEDDIDIIITPFRKASFLRVTLQAEDLSILDDK